VDETPQAWNISPELPANVSQCSLKTATHVAGKIIALKGQLVFIDTKLLVTCGISSEISTSFFDSESTTVRKRSLVAPSTSAYCTPTA